MGFNYSLEKKNFDRQWAIMRKQYEDAGMSIEVIQAMYEYDWSVFNAARSYQNHTQEIAAPSFEQGEEAYSPLMNKYALISGVQLDTILYFEDWADTWFEGHKDNIAPTTQESYKYCLKIDSLLFSYRTDG